MLSILIYFKKQLYQNLEKKTGQIHKEFAPEQLNQKI